MIEAPFSELDYSSDYLDEFHGFLEDEDQALNEEDAQIYGAISPSHHQNDLDDFGMPMLNRANEPLFEEATKYAPFNPNEEEEKTGGGLPLRPVRQAPPSQSLAKENRRTREMVPVLETQKSGGDQMFQVNDEYDQVDELQCKDEHKVMVKKATRACN